MKAHLFKKLMSATNISQVVDLVKQSKKHDAIDFAIWIDDFYNRQAAATLNQAFALATQKRRACQFLGGTDKQYDQCWKVENQSWQENDSEKQQLLAF